MSKTKVLVVDDEVRIQRFVRANLRAEGFEVLLAATGTEAVDLCEQHNPGLVLLDLGLPDVDGLEVFRRLRAFTEVPVMMVTARGSSADKVKGLDLGADDYLVKPIDVDELMARVRTLLRRSQKNAGSAGQAIVEVGPLRLDIPRFQVWLQEEEIRLTPTEFKLLACLAMHAEKVVLHEDLLTQVWGFEYRDALEYLRVTVRRIRQKLGDDPSVRHLIQTIPGVGYKLCRC